MHRGCFRQVGRPHACRHGLLLTSGSPQRLLLVAPLVATCGHLTFAFSRDLPVLFAGRAIAGFASAVVLLAQAHVSATVPDQNRTAMLGRVTAAQGVGTILGPALGGLLVPFGTTAVGLAAAAGPLTAVALIAVFLSPGVPRTEPAQGQRRLAALGTVLRSRPLRPIAFAILFGWLCFSGYAAILPVQLQDRLGMTAVTYGYVVAISGVVALVIRGLALGPWSGGSARLG